MRTYILRLLCRRTGTSSVFFTFDPMGNLCQRLNATGAILTSHQFDGFGSQVSTDGSVPRFGYGGQWGYTTDSETGLSLLGHRYYDVGTGRFLTRDPISYEGGINLYKYGQNDPVDKTDALGLDTYMCYRPMKHFPGTCDEFPQFCHWFVATDAGHGSHSCGSIGTQIGGFEGSAGNFSGYNIHCTTVSTNPQQEACICNRATAVQRGAYMCGQQWTGGVAIVPVSSPPGFGGSAVRVRTCQDFVNCLLSKCDLSSPIDPFPIGFGPVME